MSTCKDCQHWKPFHWPLPKDTTRGTCYHPKMEAASDQRAGIDHLWYSYDEGGDIRTGANFGCVHWKKKT